MTESPELADVLAAIAELEADPSGCVARKLAELTSAAAACDVRDPSPGNTAMRDHLIAMQRTIEADPSVWIAGMIARLRITLAEWQSWQ